MDEQQRKAKQAMTDEQKEQVPERPFLLIEPKISGVGVVIKADGTISVPQPKEQEHGCEKSS